MYLYGSYADRRVQSHHGSHARSRKGHLYVRVLIRDPKETLRLTLHLASSALPYRRAPPSWLKTTPDDVVDHIMKLARKGLTPSQIGVTLRDSHGIPQVRFVTGNKILRILKSNGACLCPSSPAPTHTLLVFLFSTTLFSDLSAVLLLHILFVWG